MYKLLAKHLAKKLNLWVSVHDDIFIADVRHYTIAKSFNSWKEAYGFLRTMK